MHRFSGEAARPTTCRSDDSLAQLVEHNTFNVGVLGSSPRRITDKTGRMPHIAETKTVSAIFVIPLSGRIVNIVRLPGVQFVNTRCREQFCSRVTFAKRNFLNFCIFLRFPVYKVRLPFLPLGSEPHFRAMLP